MQNDGKEILWSHIARIFQEDSVRELRRTRLTEEHVYLTPQSVMHLDTTIVNHEDENASEIYKSIVVLEMHHTSLSGDATYKINVKRQTNLRRPKKLTSEEAIAKVRSYTVTTMKAII